MANYIAHGAAASLMMSMLIQLLSTSPCSGRPAEFDWRNNNGNWLTPIKNQGNCLSQWAFVAAALAESRIKISSGDTSLNPDLSEQHLVSCNTASPNSGCAGGNIYIALSYMKTNGIAIESCFPYTATNASCTGLCSNWQDSLVKVTGFRAITSTNRNALIDSVKTAVSTIGPVGVSMTVYSSFQNYSNGVITSMTGSEMGGHWVMVVGYSESGGYWICKNTWDTTWGEKGFFRISYRIAEFLTLDQGFVVTATDHDPITGTIQPHGLNSFSGSRIDVLVNRRVICRFAAPTDVSLHLYSLQGKKVADLFEGRMRAGTNEVVIAKNIVSPGSYVLLSVAEGLRSGKTVVVTE